MSAVSYPPPPWRTHGWAVFRAYRVRAADVEVPEGFTVEAVMGFTVGLLGLVDYRPPSPLVYRELVWMPARVRARGADGRTARGYWVAKMYVDHEGSLAAGREVWGLPKQLARFSLDERAARVECEDGAILELGLGRTWPGVPAKSAAVTVQAREGELVRFRGDTRGVVAPRRVRVLGARDLDGSWRSFEGARPIGPLGVELRDFETTMQPPLILAR